MRRLLLPLLFALGLHAQDAATVARLVNADAVDTAAIEKALQSSDALVRATAGRVAMVRNATALVPSLRTRLTSESNAEAARELVRAITLLGGNDDVTFAASQLSRFPASIDAAFADALARTPGGNVSRFREQLRAMPLPVLSASKRPGPPLPAVKGVATPVREPDFALPLVLPRGLGAAILRGTRCKTGWIGVADVARDAAGRVQSVGTKGVYADRACTEALRTIARLSLAEAGPPVETPMLVMRVADAPLCFDEAAVSNAVPVTTGPGDVQAPKVLRRTNPYYPESVRRQGGGVFSVTAEATITSEGCVRDLRLVQQTIYPELNRAALETLSKWTFEPGTLNGVPVDVLFNLTITFRH